MPQRDWVPAERKIGADGPKYVALTDERMTVGEVLEWLELRGRVSRVRSADPDGPGYSLIGWGTRYFAVPFDKARRP